MKKCVDCNVKMVEDGKLDVLHTFKIGDVSESLSVCCSFPTGEKSEILGIPFDKKRKFVPRVRLCPKCGRVEFYVDLDDVF